MAAPVIAVYKAVIFFALAQEAKKYSKKVKMSRPENLAGNLYDELIRYYHKILQPGVCFLFYQSSVKVCKEYCICKYYCR